MSLTSPLCRVGRKKPIQYIITGIKPKEFKKLIGDTNV